MAAAPLYVGDRVQTPDGNEGTVYAVHADGTAQVRLDPSGLWVGPESELTTVR